MKRELTYCVFTGPPKSLYHSHIVESHGAEEDFGRVAVAELVDENPPYLVVSPEMRVHLDIEVMFHVGDAG